MLGLSSLAGWEEAVLASIAAAAGSPEERYRQIERSGMFGEYPAIVGGYVELFADAESSREALKRALFLVWRSAMFSPDLTGIAALPDGVARVVLQRLDTVIRSDLADDELAWMLAWYREAGAFALELLGATPRVLRWQDDLPADAWRGAGVAPATMRRRGQMGAYWLALAAAAPE
ncbi:MAG: hypothetical protein JWL60_1755 [Gemmatimonadetes bacterium]|nr:hypothetical protein [Gemmatimonadota bacterium]